MDPPTPKEMKAASASSDAHPVPETEKSKMDTEPTEQLSTEKSIESPRVVHVESSAPSAQRISIESVKLRAEEDKKDGGVIQEADQLKDTDTVIDVEAPEERAPTDNDTETSVDETKSKTSSSKNNGASHAVQKTTKYGKITTIGLCFLLLALGAGAVVNFLVFNTTNTSVKSSFLNETGSSSSDLFPTSFPTRSPTKAPTQNPSASPTMSPTISGVPTISESPTNDPSRQPSNHPTMSESPTKRPTSQPSIYPTISTSPSTEPSNRPSTRPTMSESPTKGPTSQPSNHPTVVPSVAPSSGPTSRPSELPTVSDAPSNGPTIQPSTHPTLSGAPTTEPTRQPSIRPTMAPSDSPTLSQIPTNSPTKSPTRLPTRPPTNPPTVAFEVNFRSYLEDDVGIQTDSYNANQAITQMTEEARADGNGDKPMTPKLVQRYAMINMELALFGSTGNWGRFNQDECSWPGITCNGDEQVAVIERPGKGLQGSIPSEVGLLRALAHFDLSRNNLQGSLPEELYDAVSLQKIYLYQNRLSGTISDKIINLWSLTRFNLSSNRISGRIPSTLRSNGRGIYKIHTFNVYDNQMTGTIPGEGSRLRQMFYMDLGRNRFSGTIPATLADEYVRLRYLYLDHNRFTGALPSDLMDAGGGRLKAISVNDNQFRGALPGNHMNINHLMQIEAQNNQFTSMNDRTCRLSVLDGGELAEFKSDCDVCDCDKNTGMCKHCYN